MYLITLDYKRENPSVTYPDKITCTGFGMNDTLQQVKAFVTHWRDTNINTSPGQDKNIISLAANIYQTQEEEPRYLSFVERITYSHIEKKRKVINS